MHNIARESHSDLRLIRNIICRAVKLHAAKSTLVHATYLWIRYSETDQNSCFLTLREHDEIDSLNLYAADGNDRNCMQDSVRYLALQ